MNTFKKEERLHSRSLIRSLITDGKSFNAFPVMLIYKVYPAENEPTLFHAAFSVAKKRFKRAVDRNLLKRRMRESFRLNKLDIKQHFSQHNKHCVLMFIYTGTDAAQFKDI